MYAIVPPRAVYVAPGAICGGCPGSDGSKFPFGSCSFSRFNCRASPKSRILISPPSVSITFAGFRSR